MLPPFSRPSDPSSVITLREATVAECIDFAGVNVGQEEEVTTLFLNRLQDKASFVDSRAWTAQDRRFGLYWYFVNTPGDKDRHIAYDCEFCGERHHVLFDYRTLEGTYRAIQGLPEREFDWHGERVVVRPLNGWAMEELEGMQLELDANGEEDSAAYQKLAARMRFTRFELCVSFEEEGSWAGRITEKAKALLSKKELEAETKAKAAQIRDAKRKKLLHMPMARFEEFAAIVEEKLEEMEHGLESFYEDGKVSIITPGFQCSNNKDDKEAMTRIRVNFRNSDYVPRLP